MLKKQETISYVEDFWDSKIIPALTEYIAIPNKSPAFDPDWEANGYMEDALQLALDWLDKNKPTGATITVKRENGRTPLLLVNVPGTQPGRILMYGHLDKQPEMEGWRDNLGPWKPVIEDDKLYGRGGADDGYALFASVCALNALQEQGIDHPNVVILVEFSEESGSPDLPFHIDNSVDEIGSPDLIVCLDSNSGNYDQFWCTTSLRGMIPINMKVEVLREGVHSGDASGIVPSSFRVARQLLNRLEDVDSGEVLPDFLQVDIPNIRVEQAKKASEVLGDEVFEMFPFLDGMKPASDVNFENVLNRTWRATVSVVAQDGMPAVKDGGNVLRPYTTLKLSLRLPPGLDGEIAMKKVCDLLTKNPPYGARVTLETAEPATGWHAPITPEWFDNLMEDASQTYFGKSAMYMGTGGTIPFMAMLGEKFPAANFVITGVLGPASNAHGPNEFLHIPYAKTLTSSICHILANFNNAKG